jgi:hypothetical protein
MLDKLQIYCPRRTGGCPWSGPRGNLTSHDRSCAFYPLSVVHGLVHLAVLRAIIIISHVCTHRCHASMHPNVHGMGNVNIIQLNCVVVARLASESAEREHVRLATIAEQERRIKMEVAAKELDSALRPLETKYVRMAVGDRIIHTSMNVLCRYPESLLALTANRLHDLPKNSDGWIVIQLYFLL